MLYDPNRISYCVLRICFNCVTFSSRFSYLFTFYIITRTVRIVLPAVHGIRSTMCIVFLSFQCIIFQYIIQKRRCLLSMNIIHSYWTYDIQRISIAQISRLVPTFPMHISRIYFVFSYRVFVYWKRNHFCGSLHIRSVKRLER